MVDEDAGDTRMQRIVDASDAERADPLAPSPARTLAAAGSVVAIVAALLAGLPEVGGGLLLVSLGVATATAPAGNVGPSQLP